MSQFPEHWWAEVVDPLKPDWEIFPAEVRPPSVILSKRNELGLLSNLAPTPFEMDGDSFASVEALWQMTKFPDPDDPADPRHQFEWPTDRTTLRKLSGLESKRLGDLASQRMREHGWSWVSYKGQRWEYPEKGRGPFYELIHRAMLLKLEQNPAVRDVLEQTRGLVLKPDHVQLGTLSPAHLYHEIWMEIRDGQ